MTLFIIIGLGLWVNGGILAACLAEDAASKHHARYVAPYLPISEWELMSLEEFQLAAELAGVEVSVADVMAYLTRHRRGMALEAVWEYEKFKPETGLVA